MAEPARLCLISALYLLVTARFVMDRAMEPIAKLELRPPSKLSKKIGFQFPTGDGVGEGTETGGGVTGATTGATVGGATGDNVGIMTGAGVGATVGVATGEEVGIVTGAGVASHVPDPK